MRYESQTCCRQSSKTVEIKITRAGGARGHFAKDLQRNSVMGAVIAARPDVSSVMAAIIT